MKKWKSLFAVATIATMVFAMAACSKEEPVVDPVDDVVTEAPAEPTEAPAEPTEAPAEPTEAPVEPTEAPAEPTEAPAEPTEAPAEPTEAPAEPTETPAEPTETPAEPTETPAEPTEAPAEPTEAPAEPTEAPAEPTEAPAEPTEAPAPTEAPVSDNLTINFADLTEGGYGYEATKADGAVNVSIATQYQEIQYVLPEVVDLANYSTLIIDVVSSGTLDIKYVNPEATENEWGQLAQFADNYTADGITEPLYLDLTGYASYDLSQINFMTCADNITFTLKSMTFVK